MPFWQLRDHSRQWDYIHNYTQVIGTQYPSTLQAEPRRKKTVRYSLPFVERNSYVPNKVFVCNIMFLNTLSIGERKAQTALSKLCLGGGSISPGHLEGTRVVIIDDEIKQ